MSNWFSCTSVPWFKHPPKRYFKSTTNLSKIINLFQSLGIVDRMLWYRSIKLHLSEKCVPVMMIYVCLLDPLVFGPAVLEPDFDLRFGELERFRQFAPSSPADVLRPLVFDLEPERLFAAEGGPLPPRPALLAPPSRHWNLSSIKIGHGQFEKISVSMIQHMVLHHQGFTFPSITAYAILQYHVGVRTISTLILLAATNRPHFLMWLRSQGKNNFSFRWELLLDKTEKYAEKLALKL